MHAHDIFYKDFNFQNYNLKYATCIPPKCPYDFIKYNFSVKYVRNHVFNNYIKFPINRSHM